MQRKLSLAALLAASLFAPGCLFVAGAAVGAGIVHAVGEDSRAVVLEEPYDSAFEASKQELRTRGIVETSDADSGTIEGTVGSASVTISVQRETAGTVKVVVTARRNAGISPDPETAEQVSYGILRRAG